MAKNIKGSVSIAQSINQPKDLIESITYLASLVSEPQAVDVMLDTLRSITSRMHDDNTRLSTEDRVRLIELQTELKKYLIHHDPVRSFTQESLEKELTLHFTKRKQPFSKELAIIFTLTFAAYATGIAFAPADLSLSKRRYYVAILVSTQKL
jgi:hypothetical protein